MNFIFQMPPAASFQPWSNKVIFVDCTVEWQALQYHFCLLPACSFSFALPKENEPRRRQSGFGASVTKEKAGLHLKARKYYGQPLAREIQDATVFKIKICRQI